VVWDIGAHIGSFAIQTLLDSRVKEVHAFEPDPLHADILRINLALNKGQYAIYRFALGSQREQRNLYHGPMINTGFSSLAIQVSNEVFEVDCRTADELVFQEGIPSPTLMKVDVEGWEFKVLQGAQRLLKECPPKAIVFETECDEFNNPIDHSIIPYLEGLSYKVEKIIRPHGAEDLKENFLALYKDTKLEGLKPQLHETQC
jgi:FkbM family methyltransferase